MTSMTKYLRERGEIKELRAEIERLQGGLDLATFNRALEKTLAARCDALADEIERLRAENDMMRNLLIDAPTKKERDELFERRFRGILGGAR